MPPPARNSDRSTIARAAGRELSAAVEIDVVPHRAAGRDLLDAIVALCDLAYDEDLADLFHLYTPEAHVVVREGGSVLSHAMWVRRWLQVGDDRPIRTGYVEFVATHPAAQGQGLAGAVMRRVLEELRRHYRLAALSPAVPEFYERLGWRHWRGPLSVRETSGEVVESPDDTVMIYWLGNGPGPDVTRPLSIEWRKGEVW